VGGKAKADRGLRTRPQSGYACASPLQYDPKATNVPCAYTRIKHGFGGLRASMTTRMFARHDGRAQQDVAGGTRMRMSARGTRVSGMSRSPTAIRLILLL
jgi:hypothetical protein